MPAHTSWTLPLAAPQALAATNVAAIGSRKEGVPGSVRARIVGYLKRQRVITVDPDADVLWVSAELAERDPALAQTLDPPDLQRVIIPSVALCRCHGNVQRVLGRSAEVRAARRRGQARRHARGHRCGLGLRGDTCRQETELAGSRWCLARQRCFRQECRCPECRCMACSRGSLCRIFIPPENAPDAGT
jgi:hypothetical protein